MPKRKHRAAAWLDAPNPSARTGWRLCWTDPGSGRVRKMTLDPARYPSAAAREAALEAKSLSMRVASLDRREGVLSVPLRDALERYEAETRRLRAVTAAGYKRTAEIFIGWCEAQRPPIQFARELTKARLAQFRASRINKPSERDPQQVRSATAVNNEMRAIKTMLIAWSRHDWMPELSRDQIADALRHEQSEQDEIEFLSPKQCQLLLRVLMAHDAELYDLTRREKELGLPPGTPRYPAIAPFAAVVLCTGMRLGEALALRWPDVDLDAGVIVLRAASVKTKRARRFELDKSPGAHAILKALREKALGPVVTEQQRAEDALVAPASMRKIENVLRAQRKAAAASEQRVFEHLTRDAVEAARKRILKRDRKLKEHTDNVVEQWSWQALRRTAATALANMPNVGPWIESKLLGHSVTVSERLYAGRMKVAPGAKTIEAALSVEKEVKQIASGGGKRSGG